MAESMECFYADKTSIKRDYISDRGTKVRGMRPVAVAMFGAETPGNLEYAKRMLEKAHPLYRHMVAFNGRPFSGSF